MGASVLPFGPLLSTLLSGCPHSEIISLFESDASKSPLNAPES